MKTFTPRTWQITLLLASCLLLVLFTVALAQIGGGYDLSWSAVAGGGGASSGGAYTLGGTAGQAAAGMVAGGAYTLVGGFTGGDVPAPPAWQGVYLPLVAHGE
jgi:uncharacterized membrane protein